MQEIFYEESAKIQNYKSAKTKYYVFKILSIFSWTFFALWLYISFLAFPLTTDLLLLRIIYVLLPAFFFVALAILLGKFKNSFYLDYDYTFVSGEIRVSKVIKEIKRKPVIRFSTSAIETLGKYGSDTFKLLNERKGVKKLILTSNSLASEGKEFYYLLVNQTEKKLLVFECTETFMVNILKYANKSIVEKDFK